MHKITTAICININSYFKYIILRDNNFIILFILILIRYYDTKIIPSELNNYSPTNTYYKISKAIARS
ncbi:hypothetical protein A1OE_901 [Candidatus Endolissoclinum faulkneri L2]|uniref:Uncharacterized protein n=1 Tax=Candidatus Endolissoclinum faulkneri L2 TaxID=1193729 RepID=K7YHM6_9PROT|nr:hypothetical protein A1OE_901 [Candidatus Endolissoclinum faulkneri L2]